MLDADPAPMLERFLRRDDSLFRMLDGRFRDCSHDLRRPARINRIDEIVGPDFLAVNDDGIFRAELLTHLTDRVPHSIAALFVDEIDQRRILVGVTGRGLERLPIPPWSRDRRSRPDLFAD